MIKFTTLTLGIFMITLLVPLSYSAANGGDQRVKDGYLVNLSRTPFTPIAGTKTVMLVSFVDLQTRELVKDALVARIRIAKGRGSTDFIREESNIPVRGGVFEYSYIFEQPGIHEIFFDFVLVNDPAQKVHEMPDFLMDIREPMSRPVARAASPFLYASFVGFGAVFGFFAGWLARRKLL